MQQMVSVWTRLGARKRMIVAGATLAVFAAVLLLARAASAPSMALLYAGLDGPAAGQVVAALDQRSLRYEVRGTAIYVPAAERDAIRMTLAGEGLPANGNAGYELLDGLSGFGTTAQMFDAAYWRAKEGELARTILASAQVRAARVHIANPVSRPFGRPVRPTASVTLTTAAGGIADAQARALKFLVASAVAGMSPEDVSIIDSESGLVLGGDEAGQEAGDRAALLKANVQNLLEARVGRGRAVVEVSVETMTDQETITERRFDPAGRVVISTDTEERTGSESNAAAGAVTVASNLPSGDAEGGSGQSSSRNSESRERVNYEVSETQRELVRAPGAIRRLSVAVLVDGLYVEGADGKQTWTPRPEEEMSALRDLVESAVGYDEARGDIVTLKSLALSPAEPLGTAAEAALLDRLGLDVMTLAQLATLAVVALALGLFVLRPILLAPPAPLARDLALPMIADEAAAPAFAPERKAIAAPAEAEEDPVQRLRRLIEERRDDTVEVLRNWIETEEKA
jgi:flagellar M-ring protein FliF